GSVDLVQDTVSSNGKSVTKITRFSNSPGPTRVRVQAHILRDPTTRKDICAAYITDVQNVGGVIVPKRVRLEWPAEKVTLNMKLDEVVLNQPVDPKQALVFKRPNPPGVQSFDLSRGLDSANAGVQPTGGYSR